MPKQQTTNAKTPDYAYWSKMAFWTKEQATALLAGFDPGVILDEAALSADCSDAARRAYERLFPLLDTHIRMASVGSNLSPADALEWALHTKIDIPDRLNDAVERQGVSLISIRTLYEKLRMENDILHSRIEALGKDLKATTPKKTDTASGLTKKVATLQRILLAIAIGKYHYPLDGTNSSAVQNIVDTVDREGLKVSTDTVRNHLNEAKENFADEIDPIARS